MNRILVLLVVLALILGLAAGRSEPRKQKPDKAKHKEGGRRGGKGKADGTAGVEWVWGDCQLRKGECGKGIKTGNCSGEACEVATKTAPCRIPCPENVGDAAEDTTGTEWTWSECQPKKGSCGKGQKTGNCSGEACEVATKTVACRIRCPDNAAETDGEETENSTATPPRRGGRPGKERRPGNGESGNGRREKPERGERRPNKSNPKKAGECRYARATLTECDPTTNLMNKTRVLMEGVTPSAECPETVVDSIRCEKLERKTILRENRNCNYTLGEFGPCDETTSRRSREDTLTDVTEVSEECRLTRTVTEKCKLEGRRRPMRCQYNWEQAETCDETTNNFVMTGSLVNVEGAPTECEAVKTQELKCKKGKVPCVLGEWGEWTECLDGTMTRTRDLERGPNMCQRLTRESAICE